MVLKVVFFVNISRNPFLFISVLHCAVFPSVAARLRLPKQVSHYGILLLSHVFFCPCLFAIKHVHSYRTSSTSPAVPDVQ